MSTRWLTGFIIIVILIIAGGYLWSTYERLTVLPAPTTTSTFDIIPNVPNETYEDPVLSFSIEYPATASTTSDFSTGYLPLTQTPLVAFELPASLFAGTNLVDAGVYIGATTSPAVMSACTDLGASEGAVSTSTTSINGQQFIEIDSTGAAAGNVYQQKVFRAFQNGVCLEIVEMLHSADIGNFPPGTVQPFDQSKFSGILDSIVGTYQSIPTGQ